MLIPVIFKNMADEIINSNPIGKNDFVMNDGVIIDCGALNDDCDICGAENIFDAGSAVETCLDGTKDPVQDFMNDVENRLSLEKEKVGNRVIELTITINLKPDLKSEGCDCCVKTSCDKNVDNVTKSMALKYAKAYGLYKISAINDIMAFKGSDFFDDVTLLTTIAQDHII